LRIDGRPHEDAHPETRIEISPATLERVRDALWAVVNEQGTGKSAFLDAMAIAGKTGTAQVVRQETWTDNEDLAAEQRDHAWFVSYGPVEDPRLAVVVFVEHGGGGSKAAAPLAKAIYEKFLETDLAHHHAG
jgi:penicillin-binding protein 2